MNSGTLLQREVRMHRKPALIYLLQSVSASVTGANTHVWQSQSTHYMETHISAA